MKAEGQQFDLKSIRYVLDKHRDAAALAADCVGFANASGGVILIGIEDGDPKPPADQVIVPECDVGCAEAELILNMADGTGQGIRTEPEFA